MLHAIQLLLSETKFSVIGQQSAAVSKKPDPVREPVHEPVHEPVPEPVREPVRELVRALVRQSPNHSGLVMT